MLRNRRLNNDVYDSLTENNLSFKDVFQEIPVKVVICSDFIIGKYHVDTLNMALYFIYAYCYDDTMIICGNDELLKFLWLSEIL